MDGRQLRQFFIQQSSAGKDSFPTGHAKILINPDYVKTLSMDFDLNVQVSFRYPLDSLSEAISMTKRYFTCPLIVRS